MCAQDGSSTRLLQAKHCCLQFNELEWQHTPAASVDTEDSDSELDIGPTPGDVDIDNTSHLYYISSPYVDLRPFIGKGLMILTHSSDHGLFDIYTLIKQCFDTYYWHPPLQ